MGKFAVIDTETNWADRVMSMGVVVADEDTFESAAVRYYILPDACEIGGMYSGVLYMETPEEPVVCGRE